MVQRHAAQVGESASAPPRAGDAGIRGQLGRIEASKDFDVPERARKFLSYVVEETLAGRAERIKAYSIALEVFGRDSSFDPQADPVVRIEAGRVRRALERYYLTAGRADPILITIPKGGYVPVFADRPPDNGAVLAETAPATPFPLHWRWQSPHWWTRQPRFMSAVAVGGLLLAAPVTWGFLDRGQAPAEVAPNASRPDIPRLLIGPFDDLTGTESSAVLARGLTEEVIAQIAKFKDLQVIEIPDAGTSDIAGIEPATLARYALVGSVRLADDTLRLTARLRKLDDGSILWAQSYDEDLKVQGVLAVQADIAREVTTALAQPFGVIFQADSARATQSPPNDWEAYSCTLAYYTYRHTHDWDMHSRVQGCLERAVVEHPDYATAWALLSIMYLDDFRFRYPKTSEPPLARALEAAKQSVALDPRNARAQQALMMGLYFNEEVEAALQVGAEAVAFNRNDTELLAEYGVRLALSGEWEDGRAFIIEALSRNPIPPTYYDADLAVVFYMANDYETAEIWIEKTDFQANALYHLIAAAIYGQLGRESKSQRERDWLIANAPDLIGNMRSELDLRLGRPEDRAHFIEGLILAGLPIPDA